MQADPDPHVVIVGAGFGGLAAAQALGSSGIRVTVVDRRNFHLFQPLLYQVATAVLAPGEIAHPIRSILARHKNVAVMLGEVDRVDTAGRAVHIGTQVLRYTALILATGATHSYFGHPEWARFAPGLKTLDDAQRIRARVLLSFEHAEIEADAARRKALLTFVLVGGGPTGVEMAGAIADLARHALQHDFRRIDPTEARILLVEAGPRILPAFPEALSAHAARALARLGVTIALGRPVTRIDASGVTLGDEHVATGTVVWAAGLAASPAGHWLGAPTDRAGRVPVEPDLSVPGRDGVYVIGDAAALADDTGTPLPGLAQVAQQQGDYLGRALLARIKSGVAPTPFRFRNRGNLAIIGRNEAVADWGRIRLKGFPAWLIWGVAHIYLLIGFHNRLIVALRWLWAYIWHQRAARIIPETERIAAATSENERENDRKAV